ncbi:MAG: carboxypeptidase-like regulatory domain-containing protein, partial [Acidobacteriota bacterium]
METRQKPLSLFIVLTLFFFQFAAAQTGKGKARLAGLVLDEAGNPVASAKVILQFIQDQSIHHEATTSKKGEWAFLGL